jgi:hypothetical protein
MTTGFHAVNTLNKMLDAIRTGGSSMTAVTTAYVQLHTGDPGAAGTANVSVGSTTRVAVSHNAPAAGSMTITGTNPAWTNGGTSETITHISVWDAPTAGNIKYTGAAAASKSWAASDTITQTSLTVSLSPAMA